MGEVYSIVNTAKGKFPQSKIILSGVLQRTDVVWRCIGALNDKYDWIVKTLSVIFLIQTVGLRTGISLGTDCI
jgi:hypothetical protein